MLTDSIPPAPSKATPQSAEMIAAENKAAADFARGRRPIPHLDITIEDCRSTLIDLAMCAIGDSTDSGEEIAGYCEALYGALVGDGYCTPEYMERGAKVIEKAAYLEADAVSVAEGTEYPSPKQMRHANRMRELAARLRGQKPTRFPEAPMTRRELIEWAREQELKDRRIGGAA